MSTQDALKANALVKVFTRFDFIKNMVKEGQLGKKAGKGFYRYSKDGKKLPRDND